MGNWPIVKSWGVEVLSHFLWYLEGTVGNIKLLFCYFLMKKIISVATLLLKQCSLDKSDMSLRFYSFDITLSLLTECKKQTCLICRNFSCTCSHSSLVLHRVILWLKGEDLCILQTALWIVQASWDVQHFVGRRIQSARWRTRWSYILGNEPFHKINQIEAVQHQKHNLPRVSPVMTSPFSLSHTMLQESHQPQSGSCSPSPAVWDTALSVLLTFLSLYFLFLRFWDVSHIRVIVILGVNCNLHRL